MRLYKVTFLVLVLLLMGCMVGPDYLAPTPTGPDEWIDQDTTLFEVQTENTSLSQLGTWWELFNDEVLTSLISDAYQQNLPLQVTGLRIVEARARLGIAVGGLYPQSQSLSGDFSRNGISDNAPNTSQMIDSNFGALSVGFDAAWEIDLWGKFRRAIESESSGLEAVEAEFDDAVVSLLAEVANTYVRLRTQQAQLEIARGNVEIQEQSLAIVKVRFDAGDVTKLDLEQALSLLKNTQASVPRLEAGVRQAKNALAALLGVFPSDLDERLSPGTQGIPSTASKVTLLMPTELLRRRPDIRIAERRLAAQSALIGVAKADLYPHFSLFGSVGFGSSDSEFTATGGSSFSDIWDADSLVFFGGPAFRWDLFNYGRLKNQVRVQDARFQQLLVNYRDTVVRALRETEDAMIAYRRGKEEAAFLNEGAEAAKRSVELSMIQYREGLVDFQRVLDTQRFLAQQENAAAQAVGSVASSLIATYKALAGGWELRIDKNFLPSGMATEMKERTDWGELLTVGPNGMSVSADGFEDFWPKW